MVNGQEDISIKYVRATNATEIKNYGDIAETYDFDPQMTQPVNVSELDPARLLELLVAYSKGEAIEMCTKKEMGGHEEKRDIAIIAIIIIVLVLG